MSKRKHRNTQKQKNEMTIFKIFQRHPLLGKINQKSRFVKPLTQHASSIDRHTSRPTDRPADSRVDQASQKPTTHPDANQPTHHLTSPHLHPPAHQPTNQPTNPASPETDHPDTRLDRLRSGTPCLQKPGQPPPSAGRTDRWTWTQQKTDDPHTGPGEPTRRTTTSSKNTPKHTKKHPQKKIGKRLAAGSQAQASSGGGLAIPKIHKIRSASGKSRCRSRKLSLHRPLRQKSGCRRLLVTSLAPSPSKLGA